MKLSQFDFELPEEQVALYPHNFIREYTNDDGTTESFRVIRRDESRLMVLHRQSQKIDMFRKNRKTGKPVKGDYIQFRDALTYFEEGDTFVLNDSKVFPARLYGTKEKTDAKIEVLLLRELKADTRLWDVLVEPARKIRIGNKLFFDGDGTMVAEVIDNTTSRGRTLRFLYDCPHDEFKRELYKLGETPLPRYIIDHKQKDYFINDVQVTKQQFESEHEKYLKRVQELRDAFDASSNGHDTEDKDTDEEPASDDAKTFVMPENEVKRFTIKATPDRPITPEDADHFQCIYARNEGSVTAPATGLHFTREMMKRMEIIGIKPAFITLHCGLGIYNNIEVEDLSKHKVDSEMMHIDAEACRIVNEAKRSGQRVCVVGASTGKATESAVGTDGMLKEYDGWTNKFIVPPYKFGLANAMIVNFYHPQSILMMETAAFGGYDLVWEAYQLALKNGYMFGCFGDSMLILDD